MGGLTRFAAVALAGAALSGCRGGEGEGCNSDSVIGPVYCDDNLLCNTADGYTCERPNSRHENQSCDTTVLCAAGLWCDLDVERCKPVLKEGDPCIDPTSCGTSSWCDVVAERCKPVLKEGDPCTDPTSCGPNLDCVRDMTTLTNHCAPPPPISGATVLGTITLPGSPPRGARGTIALFTTLPPEGMQLTAAGFASTGSTSVDYQTIAVPPGTYFILGLVDIDVSGGILPTPGDYAGWYGGDASGNPPAAPNAVVPDSGTVRFDFSLVLR